MSKLNRRGFTLVELLVVVTIIGMLVGLLVPAVQAAREAARQAKCMNNQREIGTGVLHYEIAKQHFPGYVNPNNHSWVVVILPHISRNDLWAKYRGGETPEVEIDMLLCPNDQIHNGSAPLSYVANANLFVDRSAGFGAETIALSDIGSAQTTPMISEMLSKHLGSPANEVDPVGAGRKWNDTDTVDVGAPLGVVPWTCFGFADTGIVDDYLSSDHPGMVIITFCDGHTEKVRVEAQVEGLFEPGP